jgi:hypothetical protein
MNNATIGFYYVTSREYSSEGCLMGHLNGDDDDDYCMVVPNRAARRCIDRSILAASLERFLRQGDEDIHPEDRIKPSSMEYLIHEMLSWMEDSERCFLRAICSAKPPPKMHIVTRG